MKRRLKKKLRIRPESVQFDSRSRLDRAAGVVRDCKILGMESRHGYGYTPGAMKKAIPLYEGSRVNVDHPDRKTPGASRSYRDRFGSFRNVRYESGDGLRGDFKFNAKHPIADQFMYDVENDPANCGFSHNATGPLSRKEGRLVCESIEAVRSVDLVADAATTASLFEGKPRMKIKSSKTRTRKAAKFNRRTVGRKLLEGGFKKKMIHRLLEAMDAATAPPSGGGGGGGGGSSVDSVLGLLKPILENPNITVEDSIKQVNKVLKALKDMIPGGSNKDKSGAGAGADTGGDTSMMAGLGDDDDADERDRLEDDADNDDDPPARGKKGKRDRNNRRQRPAPSNLESRLARLEAREERIAVRELCDSEGFKPTEKQLKLLLACEDDNTRQDLLESWTDADNSPARRGRIRSGKAKSRDFVEGSNGGKPRSYKDSKDWAAGLMD